MFVQVNLMSRASSREVTISPALISLYDAVGDSAAWEPALDTLVETTGCLAAALAVADHAPSANGISTPYELNAGSRFWRENADALKTYFKRFGQREKDEFSFFASAPPQLVLDDAHIYQDIASIRERDDYQYRRQLGVYRRFGARLNDNRRWVEVAFFQLGLEHEDIPVELRDHVAAFVPHIAKVAELGRTFIELRHRYHALLAVLDKVRVGLALARADGLLVMVNEQARRILDKGKGVCLSRTGRLVFDDNANANAVSKAIVAAVRTATGSHDIAEFRIHVQQRSAKVMDAGLLLEISPIRDSFDELGETQQHALLTLIDPSEASYISTERMALSYGLSGAESAVCNLLVAGHTHNEIADIRRVSKETVKSQSRAILAKTGAQSRIELVSLALRTSPPIDH